jgi:hypothetical protein
MPVRETEALNTLMMRMRNLSGAWERIAYCVLRLLGR